MRNAKRLRKAALDYIDSLVDKNPNLNLVEIAEILNREKIPRANGQIGKWRRQIISDYYYQEKRKYKSGLWHRHNGTTRIVNRMTKSGHRAEAIAEYLNKKGYRTTKGSEWQAGNVKSLLRRINSDCDNKELPQRYPTCDKYLECLNRAARRNNIFKCEKSCYVQSSVLNIAREISGMEEMAW